MAENEFNEQFFKELLDDYFEEADQHLRNIRRHLMSFEDALNAEKPVQLSSLNELFRSFHTIKGISSMANVLAAETLAHHMESFLRLLRDGSASLTRNGLVVLIDSTKRLEEVVLARRNGSDAPPIQDAVERLESTSRETGSPSPPAAQNRAAPASDGVQGHLYRIVFEPSEELAAQNINVNLVREIIQGFGEIRESKPMIKPGGQIAFQFLVSASSEQVGHLPERFPGGVTIENVIEERAEAGDRAAEASIERVSADYLGQSNIVRVELSRLDALMTTVGELVISRAKLSEQLQAAESFLPVDNSRDLHEVCQSLEKQLKVLRDGVMRVRMIPVGEVFERMQFVARDLARDSDKKIKLEISGENTEIDKLLVERLLDPLLHLVRNAVSHGIERPSERTALGKPEVGTVRLHAATVGDSVTIEISDDGRGIDKAKVATRAVQLGLIHENVDLDSAELVRILCAPGFSTRDTADKTSGRGVGMDIVKRGTEELGGDLSVTSDHLAGTRFTIKLPLTLAIADALIVSVDGERFAVPQSNVREIIEVQPESVKKLENNEVIEYRGGALPLFRLAGLFGLQTKQQNAFHAFVIEQDKGPMGIAVDKVIGQREIVVRAIKDPIARVPEISGATELGDGRAILILNVSEIAKGVTGTRGRR